MLTKDQVQALKSPFPLGALSADTSRSTVVDYSRNSDLPDRSTCWIHSLLPRMIQKAEEMRQYRHH